MARFDARKENFEEIVVLGKPALFTDIRLDRATVPKGMYLYEVRADDVNFDPVQIARNIMVNHYGSILTREPIKLPADGYLDIDAEKDFSYEDGKHMGIKAFMEKYPSARKREEHER